MNLKDAIYGRRSVRQYQNRSVDKAIIQEILEGACMAPSGINLQPWYFLAITSEEKRNRFMSYMNETYKNFRPTLEKRFAANPEVIEETGNFLTTLGNAPVVILAFLQKSKNIGDEAPLIMSVAAAIENMLLMAYEKGLASCLITSPVDFGPAERIRAEFAPEQGKLLGAIVLGYSDLSPKAPRRREGRFEII